jgi:hypothetical protein
MDETTASIQHFSIQLANEGAVMLEPGIPPTRHLVGSWRWVDDSAVAWFTAHGDSMSDAHVLRFDGVRLAGKDGVSFLRSGDVVGYLTSITHAAVDDPDDYLIGFQIWREVAPLHRRFVEQAFAKLLDEGTARDASAPTKSRGRAFGPGTWSRPREVVTR